MPTIKDYIIATRPWSFPMSVISVLVGTLVAAADGPILWGYFGLVVLGIVLFHAAANVINDYFDTRYGVDQPDSPTARYRPHPILAGMLTPRQLLGEALLLFALTITIGLFLALTRSMLVLTIGLIGFFASVLYTAGPVKYKYRAVGEFSVFLMWGPLMVEGAYAVQRQALSLTALYLSIPFGVLVALVLLANNMRDIEYDARQGIKTIGILMGRKASFVLYTLLILAAYLSMAVMVLLKVVTPWSLLVLLSLPKAVSLLRSFSREIPEAADAVTAQLDTIYGILLVIGLSLHRAIPL